MTLRQSVRGAPLVWGITPYTLLPQINIEGFGSSTDWPPSIDDERLSNYADYEALVENRPWEVFADLKPKAEQREKIVLALALPELICNVWADSVWTDPPTIEFGPSAENDRWESFERENDLQTAGWESIFAAGMRGTSIWKLHVDESDPTEPIRLDEVNASIYFPILKPGSDRIVRQVVLAWEEDRGTEPGKPDIWQVQELHTLGDDTKYHIVTTERRRSGNGRSGDWRKVGDVGTTLDFIPFLEVHGARWSGRYWGMSELSRVTSIIDEIDNRLSDIAEVLEYHGKPILQVPKSLMRGLTLEIGADRAFGVGDKDIADIARYITYDGKIDDQIASLDKLIELGLLTCEVPLRYFGTGVDGGNALSGTAMKLQLQNYLKKAARWQRRETTRLRQLGEFVMRIDGKNVAEARDSKVDHGSPLPADDEQEARIENLLSGGAVLSSQKTSIRRLRRVEDVDEEIEQIESEKEAASQGAPAAPGLEAAGVQPTTEPAPQEATQAPPIVTVGG